MAFKPSLTLIKIYKDTIKYLFTNTKSFSSQKEKEAKYEIFVFVFYVKIIKLFTPIDKTFFRWSFYER